MQKYKKIILGIIIALLVILVTIFIYYNKNTDTSTDIKVLNEKVDKYYMNAFNQEMFVSQYSYLIKADGTEATVNDVAEFTGYKLPSEFQNVVIHFVKPSSLLDYPNVKIKEQEGEIDLEVLTVFTALPMEDGSVFISSKYDEGGILTKEEYQEFVLKSSPIHGEIKNFTPDSDDYKTIKQITGKYDKEVLDGNVKYLAYDDKYAIIVISSKNDSAIIKQFLLENKNGNWEVIMNELEKNNKYKIFINTLHPNFNLALLPKYNLAEFKIISELDEIVAQIKAQNAINNDEVLTYGCASGKFSYLEFKSGYKMLGYLNQEGNFDIYGVDSYKNALQKMIELDSENPPTFIINFEN